MYKQLLQLIEERKELEKEINLKKIEFENNIITEKAILLDLIEKETQQRKELLVFMKENNKEKEKIGEHLVTRNIKITNQVVDIDKLATAVAKNEKKLVAFGVDKEKLNSLFKKETIITDKRFATDVINNFEKIEDELLDGCSKKITEFLTIT